MFVDMVLPDGSETRGIIFPEQEEMLERLPKTPGGAERMLQSAMFQRYLVRLVYILAGRTLPITGVATVIMAEAGGRYPQKQLAHTATLLCSDIHGAVVAELQFLHSLSACEHESWCVHRRQGDPRFIKRLPGLRGVGPPPRATSRRRRSARVA